MKVFWESKKWLAFAVCIVVSIATIIVNAKFELGLDANIIFGLLGLNTLYVLAQGKIDSKKTDQNKAKSFLESHKFLAIQLGNFTPILVGWINKEFGVTITAEMLWGLLGMNAVYVVRKASIDSKQPEAH